MPWIPNTLISSSAGGSILSQYTVGSANLAGATSLILDRAPTGIVDDGSFVAVGATTTKCEIRRITGIAGSTLTFDVALQYAHSSGEFVWVLQDTWVPAEWFGCKANDATFDNSTGLMQASVDAALTTNLFGLTGHSQRYYSSLPLSFYDNSLLSFIVFTAKTPFGIDPMIGERNGVPDQYFVLSAGQFATVTGVDTGTDTITVSTQVGSVVGDRVVFYPQQGATLPSPLEAGRHYYTKTFPTSTSITISIDSAGSTLDITSAGSGTTYVYSLGNTRLKWEGVTLEGNEIQGLNGLISSLQQPARTIGLRIQGFPGPGGCWNLAGQQSDHFSTMLVDGSIGLLLQGGQFHYFHATNIEDCDILCVSDDVDQYEGTGFGKDVHFWGCHWEQAGIHTARTQTIMGDTAVSAGTFTLSFGGQTTTAIAFDASAATIQSALEALSTIDPGDVTVTQEVGLLDAGGRMLCDFFVSGGQYAWSTLLGDERMTVDSAGLTGGTYSMNYVYPEARGISIKGPQQMLGVHGGIASLGATKPDGDGVDFLVLESSAAVTDGYVVENFVSIGQTGNAIVDNPRTITVPWADTTGAAERVLYFGAAGRHGGTSNMSWILAGRLGGYVLWDEYDEQLRIKPTAQLQIGDGTGLKRLTTGATSVSDGGTVTHGLGATPDVVNVTPTVSGEFASVTALGATTFTIAIKKHDGTAGTTQTVYWEAKDI